MGGMLTRFEWPQRQPAADIRAHSSFLLKARIGIDSPCPRANLHRLRLLHRRRRLAHARSALCIHVGRLLGERLRRRLSRRRLSENSLTNTQRTFRAGFDAAAATAATEVPPGAAARIAVAAVATFFVVSEKATPLRRPSAGVAPRVLGGVACRKLEGTRPRCPFSSPM